MKKIFKSTIIAVGGITGVVAPLATAISCNGTNNSVKHYKLLSTYTGQADQLIALGIKGDYYPYQLDKTAPFDYLTNAGKYISDNHADKTFKDNFAAKVKSLIPDNQGTSWWNQQALQDGEKGSNPEYWTHIGGDLVLYEHYLLDDGAKTIDNATAPKHNNLPSTFIQTNFRQSRDPFTRMTKAIIMGLLDQDVYDGTKQVDGKTITADEKTFIGQMLDAARQVEVVDTKQKAVDGKDLPTGVLKDGFEFKDGQDGSWLYNDYNFAKNYHVNFIDDETFTQSKFASLVNDANTKWIFDKEPDKNVQLAKLFYDSTYQSEEAKLKSIMTGVSNPQNNANPSPALAHHPIYDQQTELGAAPMFEGAQRDNSLYLYDLASKLYKASTNKLNDTEGYQKLQDAFANNDQWKGMTKALDNANKIEEDLQTRMAAIKVLVGKIATQDNGKTPTYGIATIAPSAQGVSTIQSSSKYSFLYRELGFAQPLPTDLRDQGAATGGDKATSGDDKIGNTMYNMDDNGWWWNISTQNGDGSTTGVDSSRTQKFGKFGYGVLAVNGEDYKNLKDTDKNALGTLFGGKDKLDANKVDYNLWNEGLKTPFVMHMILDHIVDQIKVDAETGGATANEITQAYDWGTYFTQDFLK